MTDLELRTRRRMQRDARIVELYRAGRTVADIVRTLRVSRVTVSIAIDDIDNDGVDDLSGERCPCGVRVPCNRCIEAPLRNGLAVHRVVT